MEEVSKELSNEQIQAGMSDQYREYAYTVFIPGESWTGHVGGKGKGGGQPGRLAGGILEAWNDGEARSIIIDRHGKEAQIWTIEPRIILVRPG